MDNYEHEIPCPEEKAIKRYLWWDYFHDSKIFDISFSQKKRDVELSLNCFRDYEETWDKLKGDAEKKTDQIKKHLDRFIYLLKFSGVEYFNLERLPFANDYINGRFKNTSLLNKIRDEKKLALYHFRIQVDDGYIDIIFRKFSIRKKVGRVNLNELVSYENKERWTTEQIHEMLKKDDFKYDYDKFLALSSLYRKNDGRLLKYARECIKRKSLLEESKPYAAYLLGKLGDETDIPSLIDFYFSIESEMMKQSILRCSTLLLKRNIMDAIELINYRCNKL